ncbi:MAG: hypothetical protein ACM3NQ_22885 [Bacteroidales bacterium]
MPAKKSGSRTPAATRAVKKGAPSSGRRRPHDHAHEDHPVEFQLSKKTASLIDAALEGLTAAQQKRVLAAVDRLGEEAGETVGRFVEENVVANVNELLGLVVPDLAGRGRWDEIGAVLDFLDPLDVPVDHARLQKEVQKAKGAKVAGEFRKAMRRRKK